MHEKHSAHRSNYSSRDLSRSHGVSDVSIDDYDNNEDDSDEMVFSVRDSGDVFNIIQHNNNSK